VRWDGENWHAMPTLAGWPSSLHRVDDMLVATGSFNLNSTPTPVKVLENGQWLPIGTGLTGDGYDALPMGEDLFVVGSLWAIPPMPELKGIARWDGSAWHGVGGGLSRAGNGGAYGLTLGEYEGHLVVGGSFDQAGGVTANSIALWDGSRWQALGEGFQRVSEIGSVQDVQAFDGDLYATGLFDRSGATPIMNIARWDGRQWHAVKGGITDPEWAFGECLRIDQGDLLVGGTFSQAGEVSTHGLARWDGSNWHAMSTQLYGYSSAGVQGIERFHGELIVGGSFLTINNQVSVEWAHGRAACPGDCDGSGQLDIDDFVCFQTFFVLGDDNADCDASGTLTIDDFICFQTNFVLGC
jgi:hypothetical protein